MPTALDAAYSLGEQAAIKEAALVALDDAHVLARIMSNLPPGPRPAAEIDIGHRLFDRFFLKPKPAGEAVRALSSLLAEQQRTNRGVLPLPGFHIPLMAPAINGAERARIGTLVATSKPGSGGHLITTFRAPHMGVRSDSNLSLSEVSNELLAKMTDKDRQDLKKLKELIRTEWIPRFSDPANLMRI